MRGAAIWAAVAVLALASGTNAMLEPTTYVDKRRLVSTPRGLAVENSWIATLDGDESTCDVLRARIVELKKDQLGAMGVGFGAGDEEEDSDVIGIEDTCFVNFVGNEFLADKVRDEPNVKDVSPNLVVYATGTEPTANRRRKTKRESKWDAEGEAPSSWGLDRIDQSQLPLDGTPFPTSYTGKGVNIFIIDTGINTNHREFKKRVELGYSAYGHTGTGEDDNGHGSHCAGTAAGSSVGIARKANLIGCKVLSSDGGGSTSNVIKGIEWAVKYQKKKGKSVPAVISMSLGGGPNAAIDAAVREAAKSHIVVVAAGNSNADACSFSPAAAGGTAEKDGGVITVASSDPDDSRSSFSNYGSCTDIFAPGRNIYSAWIKGPKSYNTISGTSMATPHVAGVAALMLEKFDMNRDLAQRELFKATYYGVVTNTKNSPNLLLQVPSDYTGPPTPQPTRPPTLAPRAVCMDHYCTEDFGESYFGPSWPEDELFSGVLVTNRASDNEGCTQVDNDTYGQDDIVLVPRGVCLFFDKVKNAQKGGAKAVLIVQDALEEVFPPNYYGEGTLRIPSMMISFNDAAKFAKHEGKVITVGSPSLAIITPAPIPSPEDPEGGTPEADHSQRRLRGQGGSRQSTSGQGSKLARGADEQ